MGLSKYLKLKSRSLINKDLENMSIISAIYFILIEITRRV